MKNNELPLTARLSLLSETVSALTHATAPLLELVRQHELHAPHVQALVRHFIDIRHPQRGFEQELWAVVRDYLQRLEHAYAVALQSLDSQSGIANRALLSRLENLTLLALWHYLRYQTPPASYWRALHTAYLMPEAIDAVAEEAAARYLQVLTLVSVEHGNLSRSEIALVNDWLALWCRRLALSRADDGNAQFVIDVEAPQGPRHLRQHGMTRNGRYWRMDNIVDKLQTMRGLLESGKLPAEFPRTVALPGALRLVDQLLSTWSPQTMPRERRKEERRDVVKHAQVVHGILNVCQHLKNTGFVGAFPSSLQGDGLMGGWQISNESGFGYGMLVAADDNRWLEPGTLIAMNDDHNPGLTAVGIVRSIEQRTMDQYFAGIEVLSHTPSYVRLQRLISNYPVGVGSTPFSAVFLPAEDVTAQSPTLLLPFAEYTAGAVYEMRTPQLTHLAQTGEVIEQQADWVRVAVEVAADITL